MYTIDEAGLIGEYLFDGLMPAGGGRKILNTANGSPAPDGVVKDSANLPATALNSAIPAIPLELSDDTPLFRRESKSLHFNALREIANTTGVDLSQVNADVCAELDGQGISDIEAYSQYISIDPFPHLPEMTAECWVKLDYMTDDEDAAYPNGAPAGFGFGGCPQPLCKAFSWYLFLSTARSDRNLVLTTIPGVTQGIPQDGGGVLSGTEIVGGVWTHIAFTFKELPAGSPKRYEMNLYVNGEEDVQVNTTIDDVNGAPGTTLTRRRLTDTPIAESATNKELRIGVFRDLTSCLDYQFSGKICGVRIYDRALTADQIKADMLVDNGTAGGCVKGLLDEFLRAISGKTGR